MLTPVALWGLEVPADGTPVLVGDDMPLSVNVTMAAIDPTAEGSDKKKPQLATLRLLRRKLDAGADYDDSEDEDSEDEESEDEKKSGKKAVAKSSKKAASDAMDVDEEESEDDEEDDEDFLSQLEEFVVCTLDATKSYQQTLNLHINENEIVFFKNTGSHTVYLTGNYVANDEQDSDSESGSDSEDEYDLSPDEDDLVAPYDSEEESDDLDDMEDPRITEVDSEDEKKESAKTEKKKDTAVAGKKRAAEEEEEPKKTEEPKLSKKQQKKLKANDGKPVEAPAAATPTKDAKKVKFAAQLEQGPTPSKTTPSKTEKEKAKPEAKSPSTATPRKVQGITIEDKTVGSGPAAKAGSKLKMRYVGKLLNGKQFDANTSGKPFSFVLGKGQVIKGWDVGLMGIQAGGERKLVIPAESAYGKKGVPGIPGNSTLVFEVKALAVN